MKRELTVGALLLLPIGVAAGASVDQLQARDGIGYERARRMYAFYRRQHET